MMKKRKDEDRKPVEQEISELQRKFRVLENDKRAYSEDSQASIRKQRATIEKLTRENQKMKAEMNEARSIGGVKVEIKMGTAKIAELGGAKEKLTEKYETQVDRARSLTERLAQTQKAVKDAREELQDHGGANAAIENSKAVSKQIRILENRLDQALQKFNIAITSNRSLREQIDTLRGERVVFDDIYKKLDNELQMKKKEMASIIEQSNAAYEARDSAQAQMAALKQQADKEHSEFEREWRELGRLVDNDKKMKEFMRQKVVQARDEAKGVKSPSADDKSRSMTTRGAWDTATSLVSVSVSQEKVKDYEAAFMKIQKATGICDIDDLVTHFLSAEDQNFSLFKYNNELSADIEKLEQQITDFKEESVTLSGQSRKKEDVENIKILETLDEKTRDVNRRSNDYDNKHLESLQSVNQIRQNIQLIFQRIGCSPDDLPPGVSGGAKAGQGPTDSNIMVYLAVIEQRSHELLKLYDQWRDGDDDEDDPGRAVKPARSAGMQIRLPSTVEDYSDDDDDDEMDDERPFTRDELKTKTMKGISKKQSKKKKGGGDHK